MTHAEIIAQLTPAARRALTQRGSSKIGDKLGAGVDRVVVTELFDLGLVGRGDGLTVLGSCIRAKLIAAEEEELFAL